MKGCWLNYKVYLSFLCNFGNIRLQIIKLIHITFSEQNFRIAFPKRYYSQVIWCCFDFFVCRQTLLVNLAHSLHWTRRFHRSIVAIKGILNKNNIYLFISDSMEDLKLNQSRNFQLILQMLFHFMRYFVIGTIFTVSFRLLYCVLIEVDFEK